MEIKRKGEWGGARDGAWLAALLGILVLAVLWLFIGRVWWFPSLASVHGADIDRMFSITFIITGVLFVSLQLLLGYFMLRYGEWRRARPAGPPNPRLEKRFALTAAVIIFAVDVSLALMGEGAWFKVYGNVPADALTVEITGEQFMWNIRYPGKDGTFGRTDPKLVSADNQLGLDKKDPAAKDDIVSLNQMHLPVGRAVRVRLRSKDVIHSFNLPHFRVRQDVVPGMVIEIWFIPNKTGAYEIACTQLCGLGHYRMRGFLTVESPEEFDRWLKEQSG